MKQNVMAICDVDANRLKEFRRMMGADRQDLLRESKNYKDYRELLASEKSIDAVVVATPDHWHAAICKAAIQAGKHVYCEKPLTHTVAEARQIRELTRGSKVVTQTGNQGSASSNFRRSMELIQAGVLGRVREVHIWQPSHSWPSGVDRPATTDPVPDGFDWDFWIGAAPMRGYKKGIYHPGTWRGWYDFGGGSLADFCCHGFSMPVRALKLDYPTKIEISAQGLGKESFITSGVVRFHFPKKDGRDEVTIHFHTGGHMPPTEITAGLWQNPKQPHNTGCLVVGDEGVLSAGLWNNDCQLRMKGETKFTGQGNHPASKPVATTLPRTRNHMQEWVDACKGGPATFSNFDVGGHITEIGLSGIVALRLGRDIEWDGVKMEAKGIPEAAALVKPEPRQGWGK